MSEIILSSSYKVIACASCSMHFAVLVSYDIKKRSDHKTFYCPEGHRNYYPSESDCEKKERIIKQLSSQLFNRDSLITERNAVISKLKLSKRALKAHLTIKKNIISELKGK